MTFEFSLEILLLIYWGFYLLIPLFQGKRKSSKPEKTPVQKHVSSADYVYGDDDELMQVNFDEFGGLLLPGYTIFVPNYCRDGGN